MKKEEIIFEIICNDDKVIKEAISEYNNIYHTDFYIIEVIYNEVIFAKIRVSNYKISNIFDLGYYFHSLVTLKRQKGEIDW